MRALAAPPSRWLSDGRSALLAIGRCGVREGRDVAGYDDARPSPSTGSLGGVRQALAVEGADASVSSHVRTVATNSSREQMPLCPNSPRGPRRPRTRIR